jgi:hypothetical protein
MTNTYARTLASCSFTLLLLAGLGCSSDGDKPTSQAAAGSAAPAAPTGSTATPPAETPSTSNPTASQPGSSGTPASMPSSGSSNPNTGSGSMPNTPPSAAQPNTDPNAGMTANQPAPAADFPDLRGKCGINSGFPGDETCLSAPSAEEGLQLHVGPKDYADTADVAKYTLQPGEESSECWTFHTQNTDKVWYQTSVLSGRAGTHHIINTMYDEATFPDAPFARCGDSTKAIGSIPGASKAYMPRQHVAPEYAHVGRSIPAKAAIQSDMHYFNFTEKPLIREYWLNLYFAKAEDITEEAQQIRGMGGFSWNQTPIAPGTDMVYKYSCPVKGEGYILNLLGHYHAHGKRFTASIQRAAGGTEKVFEMFNYLDPATFEYNTVVTNPKFAENASGAVSGQLAVHNGDTVLWECHVVNDSDVGLKYINEVKAGEMCNLWGASLGIEKLSCLIP